MRIAILTNTPAPYRAPVFEHLTASPGTDVRVFFDSAPGPNPAQCALAYPHEFLPAGFSVDRRYYQDEPWFAERLSRRFALSYWPRLAAYRPDVIVSAEFGWRTSNAAAYALLLGIPLLVWWEGTRFTERHAGPLRTWTRRGLARISSGLLGFGRGSVDYLAEIADQRTPIHFVPQTVANTQIATETDHWRAQRESLRADLGIRGVALLCLSRLLPHKGISQYLDSLRRLRDAVPKGSFTALFAGGGPLEKQLASASEEFDGAVQFLGQVPPSDMPRLFAASDVLVFPTLRDCWGMVVNEALAAGIPVVGSRYSGAAVELLTSEELGTLVDPLVPSSLDAALLAAVRDRRWLCTPTSRLRQALDGYSCEAAAKRILRAAEDLVVRDSGYPVRLK
jgi:glycosyltransferase involved in cell wall biosynthesis